MSVPKIPRAKSPWASQLFGARSTVTAGTQVGSAIPVTVQLKDENGKNLAQIAVVDVYLSGVAGATAIVGTAPTGGVAAGASGAVLAAVVAGKYLRCVTDAAGKLILTLTDSGTPTFYAAAVMPDGSVVVSAAITFTAASTTTSTTTTTAP